MYTHLLVGSVFFKITFIFGHGLYILHTEYNLVKGCIDNISKWKKRFLRT